MMNISAISGLVSALSLPDLTAELTKVSRPGSIICISPLFIISTVFCTTSTP